MSQNATFAIPRTAYTDAIERGIRSGGIDGTPAAAALRDLATKAKRIAFGYTVTDTCHCPLARLGYIATSDPDLGATTPKGRRAGLNASRSSSFINAFDEHMLEAAESAAEYGTYGVARIVD